MRIWLAALGLAFALLPWTAAKAHTLSAPSSVLANPDGSFRYNAQLLVGPGSYQSTGYSDIGVENVNGGMVADCFGGPSCTLPEGYVSIVQVDNRLIDPSRPGVVRVTYGPYAALTTIQPAATSVAVPALSGSGAALLSLGLAGCGLLAMRLNRRASGKRTATR